MAKGGGARDRPPPPLTAYECSCNQCVQFDRYKITKLVGGGENVTTKPYHSFMYAEFSKWGEKTRMTPPPIMPRKGAKLHLPLPLVHTNDYKLFTMF